MKICLLVAFTCSYLISFGQAQSSARAERIPLKYVSITIDDVPNTHVFHDDNNRSILLERLDSLSIPVAIFINEKNLYQRDTTANKQLLEAWIEKDFVTAGNHTFYHSRYSDVGIDSFKLDVERGDAVTARLCEKYQKSLDYFRFPYNDLGKDSLEHAQIEELIPNLGFRITPFTIESSDWMFNYAYKYYLKKGDTAKAQEIGDQYVNETLNLFEFYDSLSIAQYNRSISQIYLCHDNRLNRDYLPQLIKELQRRFYFFTSLETVLNDPVYNQKDVYYKKWGVSWFYRWMKDQETRRNAMQAEPELKEIYELFKKLQEESD